MKNTKKAPLALLAMLALPMAAQATLFQYSYEFDNGISIEGTFEGTESGNFVTGISDITLSIEGAEFDTLSLYSYWVIGGTAGETPVVSFDGTLNNFWFVDPGATDTNGNILNNGNYGFALIGSAVDSALAQQFANNRAFYNDFVNGQGILQQINNGSWQLSAVPAPGALALLGLGVAGMGFARRRRNA